MIRMLIVALACHFGGTACIVVRHSAPPPEMLQDEGPDREVEERDVELDADARVELSIVTGHLRLKAWDKPHAHLKVTRKGKDWKDVEVKVEADRKRLELKAVYPENWGGFKGSKQAQVFVELSLPAKLKAAVLSCVTGDISFEGVTTEQTRATTVTGGISLGGGAGELTATTTTGGLRISGWTATKMRVTTTTGTIHAAAAAREIDVTAVTGNITFDLTPPKEGAWSVKASNVTGSIGLRLPANAGAQVSASTFNGKVTCGFELEGAAPQEGIVGRKLSGKFGDGRGTVALNTLNGKVTIDPARE